MRRFLRIILKPLSFLPAICMMYLIFSFSAQDAETSAQFSYKVSRKVIEIGADLLDADFESWEIDSLATRFHGPIRKIAHMTEYFFLAVSVAFPLYVYGLRGFLLLVVAGFFCVAFACGDEYHQSRVAGRVSSKKDIVIDSIGIFAGILFTRIIGWAGRKTIFHPLSRKRDVKSKNFSSENISSVPAPSVYPPYPALYTDNPDSRTNEVSSYYNVNSFGTPPCRGNFHNENPYSEYLYNEDSCTGNPYNSNCYNKNPYNGNSCENGFYSQHYESYPDHTVRDDDPDTLSEDMSLKKLMHDIRDQKRSIHMNRKKM